MHEWRKQAVIRFQKYNKDADASNWYRARIMLYYPWYNEDTDIMGEFDSYVENYETVKDVVCENESKFTAEEVDNVGVDEDSRPEHAWCQLAPNTEASNGQATEQCTETLTELSEQDLVDNAELLRSNGRSSSGVSVRFESAANPQVQV